MKKMEIAVFASFLICLFAACFQISFSRECENVRADTLRLHVIANSDSDADQQVKLAVRDAILEQSAELFGGAHSKQEAERALDDKLAEIERIANRTLVQNGFDYTACVTVGESWFNTREYENFILPAGSYTALKVELGEAAGKNWWCVLYPSLCVPCASGGEPLEEYTEQERALVTAEGGWEVRFKIEEWFQSWFAPQEG